MLLGVPVAPNLEICRPDSSSRPMRTARRNDDRPTTDSLDRLIKLATMSMLNSAEDCKEEKKERRVARHQEKEERKEERKRQRMQQQMTMSMMMSLLPDNKKKRKLQQDSMIADSDSDTS